METLQTIMPYVGTYVYIGFAVWLINSVTAGYNGTTPNKDDFFQSVLWPISIATLVGLVIRIAVEKIKAKKDTK